jgi:NAD-dependent dihydropyrimidine dehydrogenase PreA subunit
VAFVITAGCVDIKDKTCLDVCPVDCIYEGDRMTYINPDECIDCGACEPTCPQEAIYYAPDLPADLAHFANVNAEFFIEPRPAGDHEVVRALPPN